MEIVRALERAGVDTTTFALSEYQHAGDPLIYTVQIPFGTGISVWRRLRDVTPAVGYWPILGWVHLPSPTEVEASSDVITSGLQLDVQAWFEQNRLDINLKAEQHRQLPEISPLAFRIAHKVTLDKAPSPSATTITLVPTSKSWEVPAYLRKSEDSQPPYVHVAIHKYWHEKWGSELVGWDASTAECAVSYPPDTYEEAVLLAQQQYTYCFDLVTQNTGSLHNLAQLLVKSTVWWFWWD